ncbi:MAG: TerB family tellurite resistance protein [Nannocystaceae bacterium]|nr:TerB family tellurite resistance protein [Myxococcales bacterium]
MDSSYDEKILDALCFLYLTFSHATDGELTADEMRTVANKIREWAPNASLEQIGAILKSTVGSYKALPDRVERYRKAAACAGELKDNLSYDSLSRILSDMVAIAGADGVIADEEREFLQATAGTLGIPFGDIDSAS